MEKEEQKAIRQHLERVKYYIRVSIHQRINRRQALKIHSYLHLVLTRPFHKMKVSVRNNLPKHLRNGGHRNTCYDIDLSTTVSNTVKGYVC